MDAEMADVVITIHELWVDKIDEAAHRLAEIGLDVQTIDRTAGVIQGSIDLLYFAALQALEPVSYVRKVIEYGVNFPPGDPRDRDGH